MELCIRMSVLGLFHVVQNRQSTVFACLARMVFMQRQIMKNLLLQAHVVVRTSKMKISCCRLADFVKNFHQKAYTTIIFPRPTNQSIDLWGCR